MWICIRAWLSAYISFCIYETYVCKETKGFLLTLLKQGGILLSWNYGSKKVQDLMEPWEMPLNMAFWNMHMWRGLKIH